MCLSCWLTTTWGRTQWMKSTVHWDRKKNHKKDYNDYNLEPSQNWPRCKQTLRTLCENKKQVQPPPLEGPCYFLYSLFLQRTRGRKVNSYSKDCQDFFALKTWTIEIPGWCLKNKTSINYPYSFNKKTNAFCLLYIGTTSFPVTVTTMMILHL